MTSRKWMLDECGVADPDNYVVLNFATNSIKADARIMQLSMVNKGQLKNYYVLGGDPKGNFEFTRIDSEKYSTFGLDGKKVEEQLCDLITSSKVGYLVYNNDFWNRRLVANNGWDHLNRLMNQMPCLPITEYEALRHWNNQVLSDFGTDLLKAFSGIPGRTKSLPKGRTTLEKIAEERGIEVPSTYEGRPLVTKAELTVMTLDGIMQDILGRDVAQERYSAQILEKENGRSMEGMGDAQPGRVRTQEKTEPDAQEGKAPEPPATTTG